MSANPFGGRAGNYIGTMLQRLYNGAACAEGIIYHQGNVIFFGEIGQPFKIGNVASRVPD